MPLQTLQVLDNLDLGNFLGSFREMKKFLQKRQKKKKILEDYLLPITGYFACHISLNV